MGAFITMKQQPENAETEAYSAYGGPFLGSLACLGVYFWAGMRSDNFGYVLAYSGFLLNLFNLLPISPLDGGRITAVLGPRIWLLGVPLLLALMFYRPSPMLIVVAILACPQLIKAWRYNPNAPENQAYYGRVSGQTKFEYAVLYLALLVVLALMTYDLADMLR